MAHNNPNYYLNDENFLQVLPANNVLATSPATFAMRVILLLMEHYRKQKRAIQTRS